MSFFKTYLWRQIVDSVFQKKNEHIPFLADLNGATLEKNPSCLQLCSYRTKNSAWVNKCVTTAVTLWKMLMTFPLECDVIVFTRENLVILQTIFWWMVNVMKIIQLVIYVDKYQHEKLFSYSLRKTPCSHIASFSFQTLMFDHLFQIFCAPLMQILLCFHLPLISSSPPTLSL